MALAGLAIIVALLTPAIVNLLSMLEPLERLLCLAPFVWALLLILVRAARLALTSPETVSLPIVRDGG